MDDGRWSAQGKQGLMERMKYNCHRMGLACKK